MSPFLIAFSLLSLTAASAWATYILITDRQAASTLLPAGLIVLLTLGALVSHAAGVPIVRSPGAAAAPVAGSPIVVHTLWVIAAANVAWMIYLFATRRGR